MAVRKLKNGMYQLDWYDASGKRCRKNFKKKCDAECFGARRKIFEIDDVQELTKKSNAILVKELADRYKTEHLENTRAANNANYVNIIIAKWGDISVGRLSHADVKAWILRLLNKRDGTDYAVSTVKKIFAYFNRLFNWGMEVQIIQDNPLKTLSFKKEFKRVTRRSVIVEPEDFGKLLMAFPVDHAYLKPVCLATWCTGMRIGEVLGLTWRHINLDDGLIRLNADETKEADLKVIAMEQELIDALKEVKRTHPDPSPDIWVFLSSSSRKIDQRSLDRAFRLYADRAGFTEVRIHDFRHSFTCRKRREGHDRSIIKAQTGHHTDSMFHWYDKVDVEELRDMAGIARPLGQEMTSKVQELVELAIKTNISLGALQGSIGRTWRISVQKNNSHGLVTPPSAAPFVTENTKAL